MDADSKAIQQIGSVGQLENVDKDCNAIDADGTEAMFILTVLEKIKEMRLNISQGSVKYYKRLQIIKKQELN